MILKLFIEVVVEVKMDGYESGDELENVSIVIVIG